MEGPDKSWRARADEAFLVAMPRRGRIALEMALLLVLLFGESVLVVSPIAATLVLAASLALAMGLVRPWGRVHGGVVGRVAATVLVVLAVVAPATIEHPGFAGSSRRLGIGIAVGAPAEDDPPALGGIVLVQTVEPHSPADGVLRVGDRIVAIGGALLDRADPTSDLTHRTHSDDLPEDTTVGVLRNGNVEVLAVHIPRASHRGFGPRVVAVRELSGRHLVVAAAVRGALLIALLLLLLRADGQPVSAIGIVREGVLSDLAASTWMTLGAFGVQIAVGIPIAAIGALTGIINREATQRTETLNVIAGQGSLGELVLGMVVAATFEEVAFRGFLTPRMRAITGSWPVAVVVVSMVFGLGHVYEGALAVGQTAFLGAYFAALFLARRRLLGPTVAHVGFNTVMLLVLRVLMQGGLVERLKALAH